MIIAIDFDGTIVEHKYPKIGKLRPFAKKVINKLYEQGHIVIIWTCRYTKKDLQEMKDFLDKHHIIYREINENYSGLNSFCPYPKIYADIYIDDRSIFMEGVINWKHINDFFHRKGILKYNKET